MILGPYEMSLLTTVGIAGVLTIAFHATGMLGKFYAEAFENANPAPLAALDSVGASWLQTIRFGAFTQVAPDLVRDTLFRFELNLRESLVLGLVICGLTAILIIAGIVLRRTAGARIPEDVASEV